MNEGSLVYRDKFKSLNALIKNVLHWLRRMSAVSDWVEFNQYKLICLTLH